MSSIVPQKRCSKCGEDKPATTEYFRPHAAYKDGLRPHCAECMRAYDRAYQEQNKAKISARRIELYNSDPDVIASREQRDAEKAQQLPRDERRRMVRKKWRDNNHERARQIESNWKKNNPDKVHAYATSDKAHERVKRWAKSNPQKRSAIIRR